jgi:Phage tail assembly chaperone
MFVISQSEKFWQKVTVSLLSENGTIIKHTFDAQFKRPSLTELTAIIDASTAASKEAILNEEVKVDASQDIELMRTWMVGWKGIQDVNDENKTEPVEFSPEQMDRLFDVAGVRTACVVAFLDGARGAKAKN